MGELRGRGRGMGTGMGSPLPALAPDTALEMALLEMARFRFMISSNSTSLTAGGGGPSSRLRGDTLVGGVGTAAPTSFGTEPPLPRPPLTCCGCRGPWPCRRCPAGAPGRRWAGGRRPG